MARKPSRGLHQRSAWLAPNALPQTGLTDNVELEPLVVADILIDEPHTRLIPTCAPLNTEVATDARTERLIQSKQQAVSLP